MITNATIHELHEALDTINKEYEGNISFASIKQATNNTRSFTLKAISKKKGARVSASGRNLAKASWHAHGNFFDALFKIREDIYVKSLGNKITRTSGNWEDFNIGSRMYPKYASECSIEG